MEMDLEWLKLYFDGLVGDDLGYSEVEWAIKEIEELRERIVELEDQRPNSKGDRA